MTKKNRFYVISVKGYKSIYASGSAKEGVSATVMDGIYFKEIQTYRSEDRVKFGGPGGGTRGIEGARRAAYAHAKRLNRLERKES